ncbi:hypothetical protein ACMFMG_012088 [Clarireedia jacksonii]
MSNPTETLVEKFKLQRLLSEKSCVTWNDESGAPRLLGARSTRNKLDSEFMMAVYYDIEGHIHTYFSLTVCGRTAKKRRRKVERLLVVPPDIDFGDLKPRPISDFDHLSHEDASAIHDTELGSSALVIGIKFDLRAKGFIVELTNTVEKCKRSRNSSRLLLDLESLSHAKFFNVYITPSDYAKVSLGILRDRLEDTVTSRAIREMKQMKEMYEAKVPELVESEPPPYTGNPTQLSPEVQVPQSPSTSIPNTDIQSSPNLEEAISPTPDLLPVYHGIFSPIGKDEYEERFDVPEDSELEDIYRDIGHIEIYSGYEPDSDEEYLAALNTRQASQQLGQDETSDTLQLRLKEWLNSAMSVNEKVYQHRELTKKLSTLVKSVGIANVNLFDATMYWCSALFLCNPMDSSKLVSKLLPDMVDLIKWVNRLHRGAEMTILRDDFLKLGRMVHEGNEVEYKCYKVSFVIRVYADIVNTQSSKRDHSEIGGNVSKRVRIAA